MAPRIVRATCDRRDAGFRENKRGIAALRAAAVSHTLAERRARPCLTAAG
jgi:hypothetical protein